MSKRSSSPDTCSSIGPQGEQPLGGHWSEKLQSRVSQQTLFTPNESPADRPLQEKQNQVPALSAIIVDFQPIAPRVSWKSYQLAVVM